MPSVLKVTAENHPSQLSSIYLFIYLFTEAVSKRCSLLVFDAVYLVVVSYQRFGGTCCLHVHCREVTLLTVLLFQSRLEYCLVFNCYVIVFAFLFLIKVFELSALYNNFFFNGSTAPWGPRPSHFSRLHDHTV
jgi:hypothetical protein